MHVIFNTSEQHISHLPSLYTHKHESFAFYVNTKQVVAFTKKKLESTLSTGF